MTGTGPFGFQYYNLQAPTTGYLPTTTHSQEITSGAEDLMFQELLDTPWHDIMPSYVNSGRQLWRPQNAIDLLVMF